MLNKLRSELRKLGNKEKSKTSARFFKTGKGEYGEGDIFLGVTVPESRSIAKKYSNLAFKDIKELLMSKIHDERLVALLLLVHNYQTSKEKEKNEIFDFYLKNIYYVNNWDLVDLTADKIIGAHLINKDKSLLYKLAKSNNLWERRIAIISTYNFIKNNQYQDTFNIVKILLQDKHDLIQKATGWMLREIGKRNQNAEEEFLKKYYKIMPRIMLRYAIERFNNDKRNLYLR